jgi:hypothetical protein
MLLLLTSEAIGDTGIFVGDFVDMVEKVHSYILYCIGSVL